MHARLGIQEGDKVRSVSIWSRWSHPSNMLGLLAIHKNSEAHARACIELGDQRWPWSAWIGSLNQPAKEHTSDKWPDDGRFWDYLWRDGRWYWRKGLDFVPFEPVPDSKYFTK
jgi:hypothetical protein